MQSIIKGKIKSIAANLSHTEPVAELNIGEANQGTLQNINLGFSNTGNVSQTVTINSIDGFVNCQQEGTGKFLMAGGIPTPVANVAVLAPGAICDYFVDIRLANTPNGSPLTDYSFNADWTWSV